MPLTNLEAMAVGKPSLAAAVGGIPDSLRTTRRVHLVDDDGRESVAAQLCTVARAPEHVDLGPAARRQCADSFIVERAAGAHTVLIGALLARRDGRR